MNTDYDFNLDDDNTTYHLTPFGCLYATLLDYGVNLDDYNITGTIGGHMMDDFMGSLERAGYLERADKEEVRES